MKSIFFLFILFCQKGYSGGFPVVDTNQLVAEIKDSAYLVDSISELVEEVGIAGQEAQYLIALSSQLNGLASDLRTLQSFNEDVADLGNFHSMKGMILADRITSFTNYLRKLKRVIATAASIRARPQAMLVTLQILEQQRQRENDKMEARMMAAAEIDNLNESRNKVKKEIARREQLNNEKQIVFKNYGKDKAFAPLQVKHETKGKSKGLM
jgi:hypothetical protein